MQPPRRARSLPTTSMEPTVERVYQQSKVQHAAAGSSIQTIEPDTDCKNLAKAEAFNNIVGTKEEKKMLLPRSVIRQGFHFMSKGFFGRFSGNCKRPFDSSENLVMYTIFRPELEVV